MSNNVMFEKALDIAIKAHKGQKDKAGKPYILHPIRVADMCHTDDERIVALLHDVIEDAGLTPNYLLSEGFPTKIVDAILSVTRQAGESYAEFIVRCGANPIGRMVKVHDLEDNMDIKRLDELTEIDLERLNKYLKSYSYLIKAN